MMNEQVLMWGSDSPVANGRADRGADSEEAEQHAATQERVCVCLNTGVEPETNLTRGRSESALRAVIL